MPYTRSVFSFIETRLFTRLVQEYFSDEEYRRLQPELVKNPEAGPVIPGSGGVRKLRWAARGRGKRGGYRVVYFVRRPIGRDLDADHLSEERRGLDSWTSAEEDSRGDW